VLIRPTSPPGEQHGEVRELSPPDVVIDPTEAAQMREGITNDQSERADV